MPPPSGDYTKWPEALVVGIAVQGDASAFAELVKRRQSWIRNLMRRLSGDDILADDLAQQVFLQAWRNLHQLRQRDLFGPWLKRIAVNRWLQHVRRSDVLQNTEELSETNTAEGVQNMVGLAIDLDRALAALSDPQRLCIVLSYHENMTHHEISELTDMPLGTVKSHVQRGTKRLRELLASYK